MQTQRDSYPKSSAAYNLEARSSVVSSASQEADGLSKGWGNFRESFNTLLGISVFSLGTK